MVLHSHVPIKTCGKGTVKHNLGMRLVSSQFFLFLHVNLSLILVSLVSKPDASRERFHCQSGVFGLVSKQDHFAF